MLRHGQKWVLFTLLSVIGPWAHGASDLALKRVMLSAGGVAYYELEADVSGDAVLELSVPLDQVDDVLKSVVVFDSSGRAGTVQLPGRQPLHDLFRDLPFNAQDLGSPVTLLNALVGARIRAAGAREIEGQIIRVVPENVTNTNGQVIEQHRVTVMASSGLQSFLLYEAQSVRFTDTKLATQIEHALTALARHSTRDRRTLEVRSHGQGPRRVRVGYVVQAPLWKASYRLAVGTRDSAHARLQGWAVLENISGRDWQDVELTLVAGNPVTFRQALYAAYYVERPEVPVEVLGRVLPSPDQGQISVFESEESANEDSQNRRALGKRAKRRALEHAPNAPVAVDQLVAGSSQMPAELAQAVLGTPPAPAGILAATSQEVAAGVSFRVPQAVTVPSGHSLLVPIIDRDVPAERVLVYQPGTHNRHPLASIRLRNDAPTSLPAGVLTLYEDGDGGAVFIGDAQLSTLPSGEQRLVSFAIDQAVTIDREDDISRSIEKGRIVNGVFELTEAHVRRSIYRLQSTVEEDRTLLIEHPRTVGWTLQSPSPATTNITEHAYRIEQQLLAGQSMQLQVVTSKPARQRIALVDQPHQQYVVFARDQRLDSKLRAAFDRMAELRSDLAVGERQVVELDNARQRLHEEQARIRNNLARIPRESDLQRRYIAKLNEQEDELETLLGQGESLRDANKATRDALTEYILSLDL